MGSCCHFYESAAHSESISAARRPRRAGRRAPASRSPRGSRGGGSGGGASPTPIPTLSILSCYRTAAPGTFLEDPGSRKRRGAGAGGTAQAACARREQPRRPRSEAAAPVRHCEPPGEPAGATVRPGPRPRRDGAPAREHARRPPPAASALALCAAQGRGPPPPALLPALRRPRSAAGERRAPGRDGRAAGSARGAAWAHALLSSRLRALRGLQGRGGRRGKFAPAGFPPLCSCTAAGTYIKGGLVGWCLLRRNEIAFPSGRYCTPGLLNLFCLPQRSERRLCLNLPSAGIIHRGPSSLASNGLPGLGREHGFL